MAIVFNVKSGRLFKVGERAASSLVKSGKYEYQVQDIDISVDDLVGEVKDCPVVEEPVVEQVSDIEAVVEEPAVEVKVESPRTRKKKVVEDETD